MDGQAYRRNYNMTTPNKEELALSITEAEWGWLRAHLERGRIIIVDDSLDLVDTAFKVATDNAGAVQNLIDSGKLNKPDMTQIRAWDEDKQKCFSMLIVSPFVLVQEKTPVYH